MLQQGARWQSAGQFYQAMDAYETIVQDYPDTDEAHEAQARMLAVAQSLEAAGKYHQALALYRRISEWNPAEDAEAVRAARRERVLAVLAQTAKPEAPKSEEKHG
jgi:tetratricopeptide (TPR) repeat protein